MLLNLLRKNYLLILILLLALILRIYSIGDNHVFFFFDQARDAVISTGIIDNKDFKLMGPSVSGTNDSVYHGVLYYYLIAPIYVISHGSPFAVSVYLSAISLIGIIATYKLGKIVFKSRNVGLVAAFFQAVSVIVVNQSTWLSNPNLSGIFIPISYYFIWKIFLSEKKQNFTTYALFGLFIALSMQSALQNISIFGSILLIFLFSIFNKIFKFEFKKILVSILSFFMGVSTMILTELLMYKRGILSFQSLNLDQHKTNFFNVFPKIIAKYFSTISNIIDPYGRYLILMLIASLLIIFAIKLNKKQIIWTIAFIVTPAWLLIWQYRDPNHTFIGIENIVFLVLSVGLVNLYKQKNKLAKVFVILFTISFALINFKTITSWREKEFNYFGIQRGAFLNEQLSLIDETYAAAGYNKFSFSSLTSPYAINTTWDYLYRWYGQSKYGYTPFYIGIDQKYFINNNVLEEKSNPEKIHFIILEPDTTLSEKFENDFLTEQYKFFQQKKQREIKFGSLELKIINE